MEGDELQVTRAVRMRVVGRVRRGDSELSSSDSSWTAGGAGQAGLVRPELGCGAGLTKILVVLLKDRLRCKDLPVTCEETEKCCAERQ